MNHKHKKALKAASLAGLVTALPIFYLAYLYATNLKVDVKGMGVVPDFAYTFINDPVGITHFDTEQYPMVIAILKDSCDEQLGQPAKCQRMLGQMQELASWAEEHIKVGQRHVSNPRKLRLVAMLEGSVPDLGDSWNIVLMEEGMPYLVPENRRDAEYPAFVPIDDSSFFRGYILSSGEHVNEKLRREVSRIVSHQYLMHYVTQQTLMWEKAKGRHLVEDESH